VFDTTVEFPVLLKHRENQVSSLIN